MEPLRNQINIGIDPGGRGCIFIENCRAPEGVSVVKPQEIWQSFRVSGGTRYNFIDLKDTLDANGEFFLPVIWGVFQELQSELDRCQIYSAIERVWGLPRNQGMFNFGFGVGLIQMAHCAANIDFINPTPQFWKTQMGIPKDKLSDKDYSRGLAVGLCPELQPFLSRIKDADRAEAFLLSQFARRFAQGEILMPPTKKSPAKKSKKSTKKLVA